MVSKFSQVMVFKDDKPRIKALAKENGISQARVINLLLEKVGQNYDK